MEPIIIAYVLGLLAASYLLTAWFNSPLPVHVAHIARRLGWMKNAPFWDSVPEWETTTDDLITEMAVFNVSPFIAALISCPFCLSIHIAFWVSFAAWLLCPVGPMFILVSTFTWPIQMLILNRLARKQH